MINFYSDSPHRVSYNQDLWFEIFVGRVFLVFSDQLPTTVFEGGNFSSVCYLFHLTHFSFLEEVNHLNRYQFCLLGQVLDI